MIVAHVSMTPLEAAPWAAAEAFREAGYDSFCIAPAAYPDGREMPTDYRMPPIGGATARLHQADIVFCHEGWPYREKWYPADVATVGWFHAANSPESRGNELIADGWPWGLTGGADTRRAPGRPPLPELIPLEHPFYQPAEKPAGRVRITCCPADAATCRPGGVEYESMLAALGGLNADVEVIADLPPAGRLRRMAAAHVVIEGCTDGSFGRTSLEALAAGCVAVNNCDDLRSWNVQHMTGGSGHPFEVASLGRLRETLRRLAELGPAALAHMGRRNRRWMEAAWAPAGLIDRNLRPLMGQAVKHRDRLAAMNGEGPRTAAAQTS